MSDNIVSLFEKSGDGGGTTKKPLPYLDYEIHLKPLKDGDEPVVIRDYGFLIANGAFYAIGRGATGSIELIFASNSENVYYVKCLGTHKDISEFN